MFPCLSAPLLTSSFSVSETKQPDDERYVISAIPPSSGYCGIGRRVQAMVCQDADGQNFSSSVCDNNGEWILSFFQERDCKINNP